jgi:hypothetical protein
MATNNEIPRCAVCDHGTLTLFVLANAEIVRGRVGCICRSALLYDHNLPRNEQGKEAAAHQPSGYMRRPHAQTLPLA